MPKLAERFSGRSWLLALTIIFALAAPVAQAWAHDISAANRAAIEAMEGPRPLVFLYLGAKHMVTGIDHVLFLIGVMFYLRRMRDVVLYASMFTIGHSLTLMGGVLMGTGANPFIVDAIIGLSVIYKGFENIGGFRAMGLNPNPRIAVLVFGLFHGLGLATKLLDLAVSKDGLLTNLVSFNLGVELGQLVVLAFVVVFLSLWRRTGSFGKGAYFANIALMAAGLILTGYHLTGYFTA